MKKFFLVILSAILMFSTLSILTGCGCKKSETNETWEIITLK